MSYSIRDAFKSLEEIDDDFISNESKQSDTKSTNKTSHSQVKLNEKKSRFLDRNKKLNEESFNLRDSKSVEDAKEFVNKDEELAKENVEVIVDVDANDESELRDSYVDCIIVECPVCKTKIYKDREDLTIDGDEETLSNATVNVGETCPHCSQENGFVVIGKVAPIEDTSKSTETSEISNNSTQDGKSIEDDENVENKANTEEIEDDLEDNEEDVEDNEETSTKGHSKGFSLLDKGDEEDEPKLESLEHLKSSLGNSQRELDVTINSIDEKSFNSLVEKYLREVYDNIDSYTTSNVQILDEDSKLLLDGKIKFKSGKETSTKFVFEAQEITKHNLIKFKGINETFSKSKRAFTLHTNLNEGKLFSKHLTYDYLAKSINESKSTKIYGRVSNFERGA